MFFGCFWLFLDVVGTEEPSQKNPKRQEAKEIPNQGIDSFLDTVSFDHGPTSRLKVNALFCRQNTWIYLKMGRPRLQKA
jgi:hypothetical protein